MHRPNRCGVGWLAVCLGGLIFMGLILPQWLWWLVCATCLVCGGMCLLRR